MNQTVVRMYVMILVGLAAVVLSRWPVAGPRGLRPALLRFGLAVLPGVALILFGFHAAGRIDELRIDPDRAFVREAFPERAWSPVEWTGLDLASGAIVQAPPPERSPGLEASGAPTMRLVPTLSGRVERPTGNDERPYEPVGPKLQQPFLVSAGETHAVVAAVEEVYRPETLYLARIERDGRMMWRVEATALGLAEGRLQRSQPLPDGDLVAVFTGVRKVGSSWERLTLATHVVVARIAASTGEVRWTASF